MAGKDTFNTRPEFTFVELRPYANMPVNWSSSQKRIYRNQFKTTSLPITGKWLYAFWSVGGEYAVSSDNGDFRRRTGRDGAAGQLLTPPGVRQKIKRTTSPKEHAEQPGWEIWFDEQGYAHRLNIFSKDLWKKARHDRPHPDPRIANPKASVKFKKSVPLPLVTADGKDLRWYFLLSSIRLGPKALAKCIEAGMADGLSIHCCPDADENLWEWHAGKGTKARFLSANAVKKWRASMVPLELGTLKQCLTVGVVDPYHMAGRINNDIFLHAMKHNLELADRLGKGERVAGFVDPKHVDNKTNGGSVHDLYVIAKIVKAYEQAQKKKGKSVPAWNSGEADKVTHFVDHTMKQLHSGVEARAAMLVNWLRSPAHQIIDLAATQDATGGADLGHVMQAGYDRAYAIGHWYSMTSLLQMTRVGASFLSSIADVCPDNAFHALLAPYAGKKLDTSAKSVDYHAFGVACRFLPDLALRFSVTDGREDQRDIAAKAKNLAALMNNIRYFRHTIDTTAPTLSKSASTKNAYAKVEPYIKNGVTIWEKTAQAPGAFIDAYTTPSTGPHAQRLLFKKHVDAVYAWADDKFPSFGRRLETVWNRGLGQDKYIARTKAFTGVASLLFITTQKAKTLGDKDASTGKKIETAIDMSMDVAGTIEAIAAVKGFEATAWADYTKARGGGDLSKLTAARAGVVLSVLGILAAAWTVWTNVKAAYKAAIQGDWSVAAGATVAAIGGLLLLTVGIAKFTGAAALSAAAGGVVGWIAAIIILVGGLIVMFTQDDPMELFMENFYFAAAASKRNSLAIWGGDDKHEWAGRRPAKTPWPVARQRQMLINMMTRFTAHVTAAKTAKRGDLWDRDYTLTDLCLQIEWSFIPSYTVFEIELKHRNANVGRYIFAVPPRGAGMYLKSVGAAYRKISWKALKSGLLINIDDAMHLDDDLDLHMEMTHSGGTLKLQKEIVHVSASSRKEGIPPTPMARLGKSKPASDFKPSS